MVRDAVPLELCERALVIKLRHHGDVLLASPVLSVLKNRRPGIEVDALVYDDTAPMLDTMHNVSLRLAYTHVPVAKYTGARFSNIPGFAATSITGNRLPYAPEHLLTVGIGYAQPSGLDVLLDPVALTQRINDVIARLIVARPELWLWMHDRWKGTGESERVNG